jgi:hypothetical protein
MTIQKNNNEQSKPCYGLHYFNVFHEVRPYLNKAQASMKAHICYITQPSYTLR